MKIIEGSVLDVKVGYILIQSSTTGRMTHGLPLEIKKRNREAAMQLLDYCCSFGNDALGECLIYDRGMPRIVHLIGQINLNPVGIHTEYAAVERALRVFNEKRNRRLPVAIPYGIGCGDNGGGDWKIYSEILERFLPEATVYRMPSKSEQGAGLEPAQPGATR